LRARWSFGEQLITALPEVGEDRDEVLGWLSAVAAREDAIAQAGRVSGSIYHGGRDHFEFLGHVMGLFAHMNVLQRDMYPSATRFESDIVAMTGDLLGGSECGVVTGGGTESIFSVVLAYRNRAVAQGIEQPEIVVPRSAHPAFVKAASYLGTTVRTVDAVPGVGPDPDEIARAVTPRTCAIVASAGDYAWGCVDAIAAVGAVAQELGMGLHVDACLGGFILPWLRQLGHAIPPFDLGVVGVTSLSADTHKFGYGPKGGSVLLYRDRELRRHQYFVSRGWPGGDYATPGIAGSRSLATIAATWAAMVTLGADGYQRIASEIARATAELRAAVAGIPELRQLGRSPFMVAFTSDSLDPYLINDRLVELGWRMNVLQNPPGVHFCVTRPNTQPHVSQAFARDLREAVSWARAETGRRARTTPQYAGGGPADRAIAELDAMCDGR
jgi:sphinganine-1-phosphate aldolase